MLQLTAIIKAAKIFAAVAVIALIAGQAYIIKTTAKRLEATKLEAKALTIIAEQQLAAITAQNEAIAVLEQRQKAHEKAIAQAEAAAKEETRKAQALARKLARQPLPAQCEAAVNETAARVRQATKELGGF